MTTVLRFSLLCLALTALPLAAAEFTPAARDFLEQHCADCHDADSKKGGLNLEKVSLARPGPEQAQLLVHLFDRISSGEMPPKKADQPAPPAREAFLKELGTSLLASEAESASHSGRTSVRRMNRAEYENAMRDIFELPLLRVKHTLPEDGQQFGFDKVSGALSISHIQMTKYLQSAERALRKARETMTTPTQPETKTWREPAAKQNSAGQAISNHYAAPLVGGKLVPSFATHIRGNAGEDFANCYRYATYSGDADSVAVLADRMGGHQPQGLQIDRFQPPIPGWYEVKFSIWSLRWERDFAAPAVRGMVQSFSQFGPPYFKDEKGEWRATNLPKEILSHHAWETFSENIEFFGKSEASHTVRASLAGQPIGYFEAPSMKPKEHVFKVWLNPGEHVSFHTMSLMTGGPSSSVSQDGVRSFVGPGVAYDSFEVKGPLVEQWPPPARQLLFGKTGEPDSGTDASRTALLENFAARAFRRPLHLGEITPYREFVEAEIERGTKFEEAMITGYKAILCSPDFLFIGLESGTPERAANGRARLGDHALASRLSFFLWNSVPDATLLDLAAKRTLAQPAMLNAQVERMLADPRSERFVEHFTDEWLELKKIEATTPDENLYPEFESWLQHSMVEETRATFRRMLTQDRSVREVVAADSILINQRLAQHYGIQGVNGSELREVKLPKDSPRGGFMTQASVLKVTANGTTTSPILRGVWMMERILGIPRSQVPENIPAVEPDATGAVTMREMIEKHRADPSCASCHSKMDPPGLALEKFDVIGGLRERHRIAGNPKQGEPSVTLNTGVFCRHRVSLRLGSEVDASGELADGQKFADLNEYRALLLKNEDALARNVARQLMIYATGEGIRFSDRNSIEGIIAKTKAGQHGIRSLIHEVVASELFQTK